MNNNEILYFPDLKKFVSFIISNIFLLIALLFIAVLGGYLKYQLDYNNTPKLIQKKLSINFEYNDNNFIKEQYILDSQVKPIDDYFDIHEFIFNTTNNEFYNYLLNSKVDFNYSKEFLKSITFTFVNNEVKLNDFLNIEQNIKDKYLKQIDDYKKLEYEKLSRSFSDFMFEILVSNNTSFSSLNKIVMGRDFEIFIDDLEYKNNFLKSIQHYFINICKEDKFKNEYFCNINKDQTFFNHNDNNLKPCEIFSENFSYQQVILSIIDKKIDCTNGYNLSEELIFKPLNMYLIEKKVDSSLFNYSLNETVIRDKISLLNYILYSLIIGTFVFFIVSGLISIYKGK